MKKRSIYFMLSGAVALAGIFGISSCSSSDDVTSEVNPTYNPETGEVNVDFVFNVSTANEPMTRMSAANTQATTSATFRGINNAYIGVFKVNGDGKYVTSPTTPEKIHSFGTIVQAGTLTPDNSEDDLPSSRRVVEISLPTEANALMFWGTAIKSGSDRDQGKLAINVSETDMSATSFSMCKIVPETADPSAPHISADALQQHEKLMAAVLTSIVRSNITNKTVTYGNSSVVIEKLAWSDYVTVSTDGTNTLTPKTESPVITSGGSQAMSALGDKLAKAFAALNTIHPNELRAGAGESVAKLMADLMSIVNSVVNATPVNLHEVVTQEVAKKIKEQVEKFFDKNNGYAWKSVADITSNITVTDIPLVTNDCDLNTFPTSFNLPMGSTLLELTIEQTTPGVYTYTYNYKGAVETYAMGGSSTTESSFNPMNYVYPAELCYFGNSPIRVSDEPKVVNDFPDGAKNWEAAESWGSEWKNNGHVLSSTRSVAMRDNINYGTALLETRVRYGAATLQDNNNTLQKRWGGASVDEPNNTIDATQDSRFVLTGVLVGGQEPEVGWNYLAKSATPGFGHMVYDRVKSKLPNNGEVDYIPIPAYSTESDDQQTSVPNYTLLWDNWEAKNIDGKQRDVYIALEFKNLSRDFYGENNLIRNGATFYIVGKLDPDAMPKGLKKADNTPCTQTEYEQDRSLGITWPTNYALPPYDNNGNTIKQRRVFMQDYKTIATFVLGEKSLQHALVAVPDLRTGQISLGLSVDMEWRTGLTFDNVILGQ